MALNATQERALQLIASDPSALIEFGKLAKKVDPNFNPPELRQEEMLQARLDQLTKPLVEKLEEVTKKLEKKDQNDSRAAQWALLKGAPYNWPDKKIQELEERMAKDAGEGTVMFGKYDEAAKYYTKMDSPLTGSGGNRVGISGRRVDQDSWKEEIAKDPQHPFRRGDRPADRRAKREHARDLWNKAKAELGK